MEVLYATDGSAQALAGGALLTALPLGGGDRIRLLTVVRPDQLPEKAAPALEAAEAALRGTAARVTRRVRQGHDAEEVLREAEEAPTDLIVLGTHGRSAIARLFLGSVAERVARHAPCSVLVARPFAPPLASVVAGFDGSAAAERATLALADLPWPPGCRAAVVAVAPPDAAVRTATQMLPDSLAREAIAGATQDRAAITAGLARVSAALGAAGLPAATELRDGEAADELMEAARQKGAAVLAVGAAGSSATDTLLLGSVAERVVRHAPCSVLVLRPRREAGAARA